MTDWQIVLEIYNKYKRNIKTDPFYEFYLSTNNLVFPGNKKSRAATLLERTYISYAREHYRATKCTENNRPTASDIYWNKKMKKSFLDRVNRIRQNYWYWEKGEFINYDRLRNNF